MKETEFIQLINLYFYPLIGLYFMVIGFISQMTDEVSLAAIACLSMAGILHVNILRAGMISFYYSPGLSFSNMAEAFFVRIHFNGGVIIGVIIILIALVMNKFVSWYFKNKI